MKFKRWWIAAVAAMAICGADGVRPASAAEVLRNLRVVRIGTVDLSSASTPTSGISASEPMARTFSPERAASRMSAVNRRLRSSDASRAAARMLIPTIPVASSLTVASGNLGGYADFAGLNAFDSDSNFENLAHNRVGVEPPDQGLCIGNGTVVEVVNLVFVTYDLNGNRKSSVQDLNSLFGVPQTDFLSDPRCYYDKPSQMFFITATDLGDTDPANDIWSLTSSVLIGVMAAGGATVNVYQIDTTDAGNPICPCFADQPLLGADQYGIYISGNEFALSPFSLFDGAEIFALNKSDLANGANTLGGEVAQAPLPLAGGVAASIQPAIPAQGVFDTSNNGTEYLMSSLDFNSTRDNRIALWAITNTCGIPFGNGGAACNSIPQLGGPTIITTMPYGLSRQARQMRGVFPVGQSARNRFETIDTGDDRMQQVAYAGGKLYAGLTTLLKVGRQLHTGILYFIVQPSVSGGVPVVDSINANYAALARADLYYPSIAANTNGSAVMAFAMSGPRYFPSSAYMPLTSDLGASAIYISQPGAAPYDGISGYRKYGGAPPARWGDYSAAFTDDNGNLWIASEFAGPSCSKWEWAADPTCGGMRGEYANWATNIGEITVP